jgi:uncharacterized protein YidB (DUF937 family)
LNKRMRVFISAGVVALALTAFAATMTFAAPAAQNTTGSNTVQTLAQDFVSKLAAKLGISQDQLQSAMTSTEKDIVSEQLAQGKITQGQADNMNQQITNNNGLTPFMGMFGGHGLGHMGGLGADLNSLSTFFGITTNELQSALESGKTLAQITTDHGKTTDELKTYVTSQTKTKLDQAVKDGKITQQQENDELTQLSQRIDSMINGQFKGRMGHRDGLDSSQKATGTGTPTTTTTTGGDAGSI